MSDTQLNREFSKSDVQRMRNLLMGKADDATNIVSGYQKEHIERKEGDIWEEDGRSWTIKKGIKQNISKLQLARQIGKTPLFCPECNTLMNEKYDGGFYKHFKHCWTCHTKFETKLRMEGKWDEYVLQQNNAEVDALVDEFETWAEEMINAPEESFMSEMGTKENWTKSNKELFLKQKEEAIEYLKKLKK